MISSDAQPQPPRRLQFSLRDAGLVVLVGCVWLAMMMQLGFVGFVISTYLAGMTLGWRLHRLRLQSGCVAGLLVLLATLFASWYSLGTPGGLHPRDFATLQHGLTRTKAAIEAYQKEHGTLPENLKLLIDVNSPSAPDNLSEWDIVDPWNINFDFEYQPRENGTFVLRSRGMDREIGGVDQNADISLDNLATVRDRHLSWRAFRQASAFDQVLMSAILASFLAAWTGVSFPPPYPNWRWVVGELAVVVVSATIVAVFLAYFYVAVGQSGGH